MFSPHVLNATIAQKAVVLNNDGKVLILKRPVNDYSRPNGLDLPGGGLNINEIPKEGIKREIKEETGLSVLDLTPIDVIQIVSPDKKITIMIAYKAKAISENVNLSDEHNWFAWMTKEEVLNSDLPETYKDFVSQV